MNRVNRIPAVLLAGVVALSSGQASGQAANSQSAAPAAPVDTLSTVDVVGTKPKDRIEALLPGTDQPKSATCEVLVANDPTLLAQMQVAIDLQNPLMGPTINLPTRTPRNPDLNTPPLTTPGSAMPEPDRGRRRALDQQAPTTIGGQASSDTDTGGESSAGDALGDTGGAGGLFETTAADGGSPTAAAIAACRAFFTRGAGFDARGRSEIARYNKSLPLAFELFDHGRYEEALVKFKDAHKVLSDAHGGDEAALMIGKIYLLGLSHPDPKEAVVWLKRAANAPYSPSRDRPVFDPLRPEQNTAIGEAAVILANLYMRGAPGIEKNPDEARKWFTRAAFVGHVPASKILGDLYYSGYETPRDVKRAVQYYKEAATLNLASAQVALADIYYAGAPGFPADLQQALAWYNQAAKQEQVGALYALAVAYDTGEGVAADPARALGFYKAAALKGHPDAQAALGSYFYDGDQVARDLTTARQWFEAGAKGGNLDAMFNLAVMMMKGEGGAKDQTRAWVWLKLAQRGGADNAASALSVVESRMTPEERQAALQLYQPSTRS